MGISTTIFMALNTPEFCNKWIFKAAPREEPLVNIPDFIFYWAVVQFLITIYILLFVPEKVKYDTSEEEEDLSDLESSEDEMEIKPSQIFGITWDILKNRNFIYFMVFLVMTYAANTIENSLATVYMTNDLKFSKESLSNIKIISVPANFIVTFLSSYLSRDRPFALMVNVTFLCILTSSYIVFVMLGTFPTDQAA
jgi:Na+/melibiose symporter-like transporter